jgi:hypothetical protein
MPGDLDDLARRAAEELRIEAGRIADTESALQDVKEGLIPMAPIRPGTTTTSRWRLVAIAAAVLAIAGTAAVVLTQDDETDLIVTPAESTTTSIVSDGGTSTLPASTTTSTSTTVAPDADTIDLGNGLSIDRAVLPFEPVQLRRREIAPFADAAGTRAGYRVDLVAEDGTFLTVAVGSVDTLGEGAPTRPIGDGSEAISVIEADRIGDPLDAVLDAIVYDPELDTRTVTTIGGDDLVAFPTCETDPAVNGDGTNDLVIFLCDGTFGRFNSSGALVEEIATFEDQRQHPPEEGPGPASVDGITVSADGRTVFYSVGPEPAVGTIYRYVLGSGAEPDVWTNGFDPVISPDGTAVAAVVLDGIALFDAASVGAAVTLREVHLDGMYPSALRWSPDGTQITFHTGSGLIGVVDLPTDDVRLHGPPVDLACGYTYPAFRVDGALTANQECGDTVEFAIVGPPGNQLNLESGGEGGPVTRPVRSVPTPDGGSMILENDRLGTTDAPTAIGVLEAAFVPG